MPESEIVPQSYLNSMGGGVIVCVAVAFLSVTVLVTDPSEFSLIIYCPMRTFWSRPSAYSFEVNDIPESVFPKIAALIYTCSVAKNVANKNRVSNTHAAADIKNALNSKLSICTSVVLPEFLFFFASIFAAYTQKNYRFLAAR